MPSRRQERVGKRVMQELIDAFRNLKNVTLGFITVTRCEVSPDLRHAKVFVSVFGTDEEKKNTMAVLKRNASRLKGMIGRPLGTKVVPDLHFEFDETLATADEMSRLIRDARASDVNPGALAPEEEADRLAAGTKRGDGAAPRRKGADVFEDARYDVEDDLFDDYDDYGGVGGDADGDADAGAGADDPDWQPINLDELPDEDDD